MRTQLGSTLLSLVTLFTCASARASTPSNTNFTLGAGLLDPSLGISVSAGSPAWIGKRVGIQPLGGATLHTGGFEIDVGASAILLFPVFGTDDVQVFARGGVTFLRGGALFARTSYAPVTPYAGAGGLRGDAGVLFTRPQQGRQRLSVSIWVDQDLRFGPADDTFVGLNFGFWTHSGP